MCVLHRVWFNHPRTDEECIMSFNFALLNVLLIFFKGIIIRDGSDRSLGYFTYTACEYDACIRRFYVNVLGRGFKNKKKKNSKNFFSKNPFSPHCCKTMLFFNGILMQFANIFCYFIFTTILLPNFLLPFFCIFFQFGSKK